MDIMGDHDEGTCSKRQGMRTYAHNAWANTLVEFLKASGFINVQTEVLDWDGQPSNGWRRVPDITCTAPNGVDNYIIDVRIAWNITTGSAASYGDVPGKLAADGETSKRNRWKKAVAEHRDFTENTKFIPFSAEISGGWGPATEAFFNTCCQWAGNVRDVDLYHWSSASFKNFWMQTLGVCLTRERGKVGLAAAKGYWPKRILKGVHVECTSDAVV